MIQEKTEDRRQKKIFFRSAETVSPALFTPLAPLEATFCTHPITKLRPLHFHFTFHPPNAFL